MARLILVRHGQSESNLLGALDSAEPGAPLTALGRQQAAALPHRYAEEGVERIVASPLARAVATAAPLAAALGLPLGTDHGVREVRVGDLEMHDDAAARGAHAAVLSSWASGDLAARLPGSPEDGHGFLDRYDRAVAAAVEGVRTVLVVSHGDAIRIWSGSRARNADLGSSLEHGLANTGAVVLEGSPGDWRIVERREGRVADPDEDPTGAPVPRSASGAAPHGVGTPPFTDRVAPTT